MRLEAKVLALVTRVVEDLADIEDDETECKTDWPTDAAKAARQIAGLANAARGRDVLWLIGVDEGTNQVASVDKNELSNWWSSVAAQFDGVTPELQSLWVDTEHGFVMALLFSTDRSPYVVKVKAGSAHVHKEVPWRGANGTNTAKREQLLSMLVENVSVPEIELFAAQLDLTRTTLTFTATLDITAIPPTHRPSLLPRRMWSVRVESPDWAAGQSVSLAPEIGRHIIRAQDRVWNAQNLPEIRPPEFDPESPYGVYVRRVGLIVAGSDSLTITASADAGELAIHCDGPLMSVIVDLPIERTDRVARARCDLRWTKIDDESDFRGALWTERY